MDCNLNIDERWLGFLYIKNFDDYSKIFVPTKTFSEKVDPQIIESYKVVDTMLKMAWYYYPLYDEARNKMFRIFEIAVRICANNHELTLENKKGNKTPLQVLVDQLPIKQSTMPIPKFVWYTCFERGKEIPFSELNGFIEIPKATYFVHLRNDDSHPDMYGVGAGLFGKVIFEEIIDLINEMFEN